MARLTEVAVSPRSLDPLRHVAGDAIADEVSAILALRAERMKGRVFWNVNSTAKGGGVAELLKALLPYTPCANIDARWLTIQGDEEFFRITKRLHHLMHGGAGDGGPLGPDERRHYERVLADHSGDLTERVGPDDIVLLHDPQTAGLAPAMARRGCTVLWRCHIGADEEDELVRSAWQFLLPYLGEVEGFVFSREKYVPDVLPRDRCTVVQPCIDPLSSKNQSIEPEVGRSILRHAGLLDGAPPSADRCFLRSDGSRGRVERRARVFRDGQAPHPDRPLVVQVSRWDSLKDPLGVMEGFRRFSESGGDAELVLAGPSVDAVADDPEGAEVLESVQRTWSGLTPAVRRRVHLACLPMADVDENAAIVNALQRHATVIAQKSLKEGFGLTVTEAMWKSRPVVASAVGGIQEQIVDGQSGLLLQDPRDPDEFAAALHRLLDNSGEATRLGDMARSRVMSFFLCNRHFRQLAELLDAVEARRGAG